MTNRTLRIFVSATSADLGSYRKAVSDELLHREITPVEQDHFSPTFRTVQEELTRKIQSCDAVICLVGVAFGEEPRQRPSTETRQSYTQMEYRLAKKLKKPVFLFIASERCRFDSEVHENDDKALLQKSYREDLRGGNTLYAEFLDEANLRQQIGRIPFNEIPQRSQISAGPAAFSVALLAIAIACIAVFANRGLSTSKAPIHESRAETDPRIPVIASDDSALQEREPTPPEQGLEAQGPLRLKSAVPTKISTTTPDFPASDPSVTLILAESYRTGEKMELSVKVHRAGFLYIGAAWADGSVYLLYPNFHHPLNGENRVKEGEVLRLPGDLPPAADGRVITYPMEFPDSSSGDQVTESIFAFVSAQPAILPDVAADLGPAFRRLGMLRDPKTFRERGPKPRLEFQDWALPLSDSDVVIKSYTLTRK